MSTVTIQKRKRKHGTTYPVYFKNPFNYRKEYFKTFPKLKEAQIAANELRALLDAGKGIRNTFKGPSHERTDTIKSRYHDQARKVVYLKRPFMRGKLLGEYSVLSISPLKTVYCCILLLFLPCATE